MSRFRFTGSPCAAFAVVLGLLSFFACCPLAMCESPAPDPATVLAVEWIPLHTNSVILKAAQSQANQPNAGRPGIEFVRVNVFGDQQELTKLAEQAALEPPQALIGFGDHVCKLLQEACPNVPMLALLVRDPDFRGASSTVGGAPLLCPSVAPDPKLIWRIARELDPDLKRLGMIYTKGDMPNTAFADQLSRIAQDSDGTLDRTTVPPGFCRTDSDFERAVKKLVADDRIDMLYVPDDPNCSRFGIAIYKSAGELNVPAIGTDATIGKGCVAAIQRDYEALGVRVGELIRILLADDYVENASPSVRRNIVFDARALRKHGLSLSSWMKKNSRPLAGGETPLESVDTSSEELE